LNLHQNKPPTWLVHIPGHLWVLGQATGTLDHKTHHGLDSGEATTFPHIVFFAMLRGGYIQMAFFPGTPKFPKLSRNYPRTLGACNSRLLGLITTRSKPNLYPSSRSFQQHITISIRRSGRGLFPTFSSRESNWQFDSRPFFCPELGLQISKWPMRGHFRYLRFKTFPMTPRTPQCEVFWALL